MNALFEQYRAAVIAVVVVVLLAVGVGIGWSLNGWRLSGQVADAKTETANARTAHQADLAAISNAAAQQVREALAKQQDAQQKIADLDRKHTEEMQNAKDENDRLRGDVADGRRRLQLKASCPAIGSNLPNATSTASLGDGAGARLDEAAERDYWSLRSGIATARNQIAALQQYVREVCLKQ
ncbi:lysis protein [Pseudomonas oryzihabitans]|uniref:lysis protein n=1 Tax=Pseudomonas oryzihabitans TaxID=47885 RepID=UPI001C92E0F0|nr:lysis protein [Pseudomonas oryzihabitans]